MKKLILICLIVFMNDHKSSAQQLHIPDAPTVMAGDGRVIVKVPIPAEAINLIVYYDTAASISTKSQKITKGRNGSLDSVSFEIPNLTNGKAYFIGTTYTHGNPAFAPLEESSMSVIQTVIPQKQSYVHVLNMLSGNISQFSLNQLTGRLTPVSGGVTGVGLQYPVAMAISKTNYLYVHSLSDVVNLSGLNANYSPIQPMPNNVVMTGNQSCWITTGPKGDIFHEVYKGGNAVSWFDLQSANGYIDDSEYINCGSSPVFLVVHPNGNYAYVANSGDKNIVSLNRDSITGALSIIPNAVASGSASANFMAIDPSGLYLYMAASDKDVNGNNLYQYKISSNGVLQLYQSYTAGNGPSSIAIDENSNFIYVTNENDNTISGFVISNNYLLKPIEGSPFPAGNGPRYIAGGLTKNFSRYFYVTNGGDNTLNIYSKASDGALTFIQKLDGTQGIGNTPVQVLFQGEPCPAPPKWVKFNIKDNQLTFDSVDGAVSYIAYISDTSTLSNSNYTQKIVGVKPSGQQITNLLSGRDYYVIISATNAFGEGISSPVVLRR